MTHLVVLNDEEQYSVWPAGRPLPTGWHPAGVRGSEEECLDHIGRVWTDIRPRSVRARLAAAAAVPRPALLATARLHLRELPAAEARLLVAGTRADGIGWAPGYPTAAGLAAVRDWLARRERGAATPGLGPYQLLDRDTGLVVGDAWFEPTADGPEVLAVAAAAADTGLADTGLADTGLADPGLADPGLAGSVPADPVPGDSRSAGSTPAGSVLDEAVAALADWAAGHPDVTEVRTAGGVPA